MRSPDPAFRTISRMSLPTQVFQINEPIFFGLPIVLNPIFMIPYVLNALILTTGSYLLMQWGLIHKPFVNVPWTTPPIIGHYLVSGGDITRLAKTTTLTKKTGRDETRDLRELRYPRE